MSGIKTAKRILSFIAAVAVILGGGINVSAYSGRNGYICVAESEFNETMFMPETKVTAFAQEVFSQAPQISETREVKWIDRISDKPDYAVNFYSWLIENSKNNGALITGIDEYIGNTSVHKVNSIPGNKNFVFTRDIPANEIEEAALNSISDELYENFIDSASWISVAVSAFDRDHPEVFWLSGNIASGYTLSYDLTYNNYTGMGTIRYTQNIYFYLSDGNFDIRMPEYGTAELINEAIAERDAAVDEIVSGTYAEDVYGKLQYLNDYIIHNNSYNNYVDSGDCSQTAHRSISALCGMSGKYAPVCEGYAKAFKVLCDEMGIPCVLSDGISLGVLHMWNCVEINGNWYAVDTTWNDPATGSDDKISGQENENYFLVGSETVIDGIKFKYTHIVLNIVMNDGMQFLNEPLLSKVTYNSTVSHICTLEDGYCTYCRAAVYDVNRDSECNIFDLIAIKQILLEEIPDGNPDCNSDGYINSLDIAALKRYLWNKF